MTSQHKTNTHPFLWQAGKRPALIFLTSQQNTGTHPFYIGMYIQICTHIYVHIYTSQKECLHIFSQTQHLAMSEIEEMIRQTLSETLRSYPDVVPSVKGLNEEEVELMSKTLEVHKDWNCQARFLESLHPDWKCDKPEQSGPIARFLQQNMCLLQVMNGKLY